MVGAKIKTLRLSKDLTLDDLAKKVGSTKSYIWEIENKPNIRPSAELIHKLSVVLEVTMEELMGEKSTDGKDQVFFREYKKLKPETQKQLQKILRAIEDNDNDRDV